MQDKNVIGILLIGHPGTGKSLFAKAVGNEGGRPTVAVDISGMKGGIIGQSGANIRTATKVIDAIAGNKTKLLIATCNNIGALPPEFRRRFKRGTFFVDLPDDAERDGAWEYFLNKYKLTDKDRPKDAGWTPAEVESCCETAYDLGMTLKEAAEYIVPIAEAAKDSVERLRDLASGVFISANYPGKYRKNTEGRFPQSRAGRAIKTGAN